MLMPVKLNFTSNSPIVTTYNAYLKLVNDTSLQHDIVHIFDTYRYRAYTRYTRCISLKLDNRRMYC